MIESVEVQHRQEQPVAVVRGHARADEIGAFVGRAYGQVMAAMAAAGAAPIGPPVVRYFLSPQQLAAGADIDAFEMAAGFPCPTAFTGTDEVQVHLLPAGDAVVVVHVGQWQELGEAYAAVEDRLAALGLEHAGPPWETYLDGPEAAVHRTVLTAPCRPAA